MMEATVPVAPAVVVHEYYTCQKTRAVRQSYTCCSMFNLYFFPLLLVIFLFLSSGAVVILKTFFFEHVHDGAKCVYY